MVKQQFSYLHGNYGNHGNACLFFVKELDVKAGGGVMMTIGQMLRQWLTKLEWFDTLFPRIPVPIQKQIMDSLRYKYGNRVDTNAFYEYG